MENLFKKPWFWVIIAGLLIAGGILYFDEHQKSDDVAIRVNDTEISKEDFDLLSGQIVEQYRIYGLGEVSEEEVIGEVIQQVILLDHAISEGMEVTSEEMDEEIRSIVDMYDMETEEELIEELEMNSIDELERALRREIKIDKLIDHYKEKIEISEEDIEEAYNEYYMQMEEMGEEVPSIDEMRDQIRGDLAEEEALPLLISRLEELEEEADVETFIGEDDVHIEEVDMEQEMDIDMEDIELEMDDMEEGEVEIEMEDMELE